MKNSIPFILIILFSPLSAKVEFEKYFIHKTLRMDYIHAGNATSESIYPEQFLQEPFWGGSLKNLLDTSGYGSYRFLVYDSVSGEMIYSRGYNTLFEEWQTTEEAVNTGRAFYETILCPYPKNTIRIEIQTRSRKGVFHKLFEQYLNPSCYFIKKEIPVSCKSYRVSGSGQSSEKVDIVIIAEGYTKKEMGKFRKDVQRFAGYFFSVQPFLQYRDRFTIWAVESFSSESGTDIPGQGVWKKTAVNSHFYTFDSDRYLTSSDVKSIRDIASNVPYDQIVVLVNSSVYGGGGIFNYYSFCTSDNEYSAHVFIHEFGHAFGGLADEYYDSEVSYTDYYDLDVEPWEPNLTTLKEFGKKWKDMLDPLTPVPTPGNEAYKSTVGVFEGGGYINKGMFRPYLNCRMKSNSTNDFCPVCQKALARMILFYTD